MRLEDVLVGCGVVDPLAVKDPDGYDSGETLKRIREAENELRNEKHESTREQFEGWIAGPPYEREVKRWPKDETKHSWPGQYCDITVQLAWEAWCASAESHLE